MKLGLEEGIQEGRQKGLQEGRQEGIQEGRQEGRQEERETMARKLIATGMSVSQVAQLTELSEARVMELLG